MNLADYVSDGLGHKCGPEIRGDRAEVYQADQSFENMTRWLKHRAWMKMGGMEMTTQKPGWEGIKEFRDMYSLWERLPRSDQKIWIDFMEILVSEWEQSERANFFIGVVFGACILATMLLLGGGA